MCVCIPKTIGFAKGKMQCSLYVAEMKKYKLLSDVMTDVGRQATQFVYRLEVHGQGYVPNVQIRDSITNV